MNDYECTNPQRRRIEAHQEANAEVWESEEWREAKAVFLSKNPLCHWCRAESRVPHHPDYEVYGKPEYLDLSGTLAYCNDCHSGTHNGKFQCPICLKLRSKTEGERCYSCLDSCDKRRIKNNRNSRNEVKNRAGRKQYIKAHPTKKVVDPKTGKWVSVKR
jgi:hypothetical protein